MSETEVTGLFQVKIKLANLSLLLFIRIFRSFFELFYLKNFRELILFCSDKMMCVSLFSYQGSLLFSSDNFDSLSCSKPFVKNFFIYFFAFRKQLFTLSSDNFYILSYQLSSVKNFFNFSQNHLTFKKSFCSLATARL